MHHSPGQASLNLVSNVSELSGIMCAAESPLSQPASQPANHCPKSLSPVGRQPKI